MDRRTGASPVLPDSHAPEAPCPLTVVVPAYNEAERIAETIRAVVGLLRAGPGGEIIVVDDGSHDRTAEIAGETLRAERTHEGAAALSVRLLENERNRGKGYAVRRGVLASRGDLVLITDADLSVPLSELRRLRAAVDSGAVIAIGSRDVPGARLDPPQTLLRRGLAALLRTVRRALLLPALRDTQCGFKLLRGDVARRVFAVCEDDGWLFDCEFLGIAAGAGYRISEVGVLWRRAATSRVRPLRAALPVAWKLITLRARVRSGVQRLHS